MSKDSSVIYGDWLDPDTKMWYHDTNRRIWVDCDDTADNREYFNHLKRRLKILLKQCAIYMTISKIEVL
jgi:hypothetical protein